MSQALAGRDIWCPKNVPIWDNLGTFQNFSHVLFGLRVATSF